MIKKCSMNGCFNVALSRGGYCMEHVPVHLQGRRKYNDAPKIGKTLTFPCGWLSCEIECELNDSYKLDKVAAVHKWSSRDGSLRSGGIEFKIAGHCCSKRGCTTVTIAESVVSRAAQAGAIVSHRCGFHVHVDVREIEYERTWDFLRWLHNRCGEFMALVPSSRRDNEYCRVPSEFDSYNYRSHYNWISKTAKDTIEIRIHPGTLNPLKVRGWLSYWKDVGHWLRSDKPFPDSIYDMSTGIGREYLEARRNADGVLRIGTQDIEGENVA